MDPQHLPELIGFTDRTGPFRRDAVVARCGDQEEIRVADRVPGDRPRPPAGQQITLLPLVTDLIAINDHPSILSHPGHPGERSEGAAGGGVAGVRRPP